MVDLKSLTSAGFDHGSCLGEWSDCGPAISTVLLAFSGFFFQLNIKRYKKLGLPPKKRFFKVNSLTNAFTFELDWKGSR